LRTSIGILLAIALLLGLGLVKLETTFCVPPPNVTSCPGTYIGGISWDAILVSGEIIVLSLALLLRLKGTKGKVD
jgi:hypothetical protein